MTSTVKSHITHPNTHVGDLLATYFNKNSKTYVDWQKIWKDPPGTGRLDYGQKFYSTWQDIFVAMTEIIGEKN
jgi:hypothetical protein